MIKAIKFMCITILLIAVACSKDNSNIESINTTKDKVTSEIKEGILNLINVEPIAETPISYFDSFIVKGDEAFFVKGKDTYVFDFKLASWTFLGTDAVMPDSLYGQDGISFMRNNKWNLLSDVGLFEFDFELQDWQVIKLIPQSNGLFTIQGVYIVKDDAVYFVDPSNGNENIYKYGFITNEAVVHNTRENNGNFERFSNNTFFINSTYYYLVLNGYNSALFSKYNEDLQS